MSERKLATIRTISAIDPIPGADAIDVATIDGWKVVVKKNDFSVNDLAIYFEIDSWIPAEIAPFLSKGREYNGVVGERLRTIKLRGQISQGLLLPLDAVCVSNPVKEGDDLTELLNIQKWEKELSSSLNGVARGNFPSFIPKTNQERIQNVFKTLNGLKNTEAEEWEVTEKLDGSSMTVYYNYGNFGVCSRNLDLLETEGNMFWNAAKALNLHEKMTKFGSNIALQGELIGEGIQGNKYGLKGQHFYVFDVFSIDEQSYIASYKRNNIASIEMGLSHAPILDTVKTQELVDYGVEKLLKLAEGKSEIGNRSAREGLVYKSFTGKRSFKAISNAWLLKNNED